MVGLTEELETFVDLMELSMPRFFKGAGVLFRSSENNKHIRKTIHKDPVSQQTINVLKETRVWKAEMEFYEFAKAHFMNLKEEWQNLGPNNRIYHYDKIRPRKNDWKKIEFCDINSSIVGVVSCVVYQMMCHHAIKWKDLYI